MIALVDYGAGNLYSLSNSLTALGLLHSITASAREIELADSVILPGVGAFPDAMKKLSASGLIPALKRAAAEKPFLGICLGMQLLFERGYEFGEHKGLGLIPGSVRLINTAGQNIPHMGWNDVKITNPCALTAGMKGGEYLYFVHSYMADTEEKYVSLETYYGERIPALVHSGQVFGAQFHPEKSSGAGLQILKSFGGIRA